MAEGTSGAFATAYVDILVSTAFAKSLAKARGTFQKAIIPLGKTGTGVFSRMANGVGSAFMKMGRIGVRSLSGISRGVFGLTKGIGGALLGGIRSLASPLSALIPMLGGAAIFGGSAVAFGKFEYAMARVKAITGATAGEYEMLSEKSRDLGRRTMFSASEAAESMGYFAVAGFKVNEIVAAMDPTLDLAAAGQLDMATASDIVAKIMRGMGLDAKDTTRAVDVLTKAFTTANTDLPMLGDAFKYVGPIAKSAGISLEEVTASIQILSDAGIQGQMAGTTLRNILMRMQAPTKEARKAFKTLGIEIGDSNGKMKPMATIIDELNAATAGMTDMQKQAILSDIAQTRGLAGLLELMDAGGNKMREYETRLKGSAGWAKQVADIQMNTLKGSWDNFTSALEDTAIELGKAMAPAIRLVLDAFVGLFNTMTPLMSKVDEVAMAIGTRLANAIKGASGWLKEHADLWERVLGFLTMSVTNPLAALKAAGLTIQAGGLDLFASLVSGLSTFVADLRALFTAAIDTWTSRMRDTISLFVLAMQGGAARFIADSTGSERHRVYADAADESLRLEAERQEGTLYKNKFAENLALAQRQMREGGINTFAQTWADEMRNMANSLRGERAGILAENQAKVDADRAAARAEIGKRKLEGVLGGLGRGVMGSASGPLDSLNAALGARAGTGGGAKGLLTGLGRMGLGALSGMAGMFSEGKGRSFNDKWEGISVRGDIAGLSPAFGRGLNSLLTPGKDKAKAAMSGLGNSIGKTVSGAISNPLASIGAATGIFGGMITGGPLGLASAALAGLGLEETINRTEADKKKNKKKVVGEGGGEITDVAGFLAGMQKQVLEAKKDKVQEDIKENTDVPAIEAPRQTTLLGEIKTAITNLSLGFT